MNRGLDGLGVSEIDINPKGRGGEVCAQGPRLLFMRSPAWINRLARHWGFGGGGQGPLASQDAAALRPITRQTARLCNS
jgi:hypothetical protein